MMNCTKDVRKQHIIVVPRSHPYFTYLFKSLVLVSCEFVIVFVNLIHQTLKEEIKIAC